MLKKDVFDSTPHVRKAMLDEPAGKSLQHRLGDYLRRLAIPETLIDAWLSRACEGEVDARLAFMRLQALMAEYWRQQTGMTTLDDAKAVALFRMSRWVMPNGLAIGPDCPASLEQLVSMPPIRRRSMVPEPWDD